MDANPIPAEGTWSRFSNMTFTSFYDPTHLYFVTASICGWKHLFVEPTYSQIILDSLVWLQKEKRILLFAFVIMPSHLHLILKPEQKEIAGILKDFGSFTAHAILRQLREHLLQFFHTQRRDTRHQHSIWRDIQAKNIYSHEFLSEKMEYLHSNPISKDWHLVKERGDYRYSSACFYDNGDTPIIPITDINEWLML